MNREETTNYIQEWLKDKYALTAGDRAALNASIEALKAQGALEQIKWERDTALATLEEHGIGLGQKKNNGPGPWAVAQKVFGSTLTYREAVDYLHELEKQEQNK